MMLEQENPVCQLACTEVRGGNDLARLMRPNCQCLNGWVSCQPLRRSRRGGDVYYMSSCSQGVVARVVLADVAGHGEAVSDAAIRLRDALRKHVELWDQSRLIRHLNENFLTDSRYSQFATAFLAELLRGVRRIVVYQCGPRASTLVSRG